LDENGEPSLAFSDDQGVGRCVLGSTSLEHKKTGMVKKRSVSSLVLFAKDRKVICYLTDIQRYDENHLAWLYNRASLHAINRFFMQVRRRLSLLERPVSSSASLGRRWFGYGPYKHKKLDSTEKGNPHMSYL
jgi:hypothetical protein